MNQQLTTTEHTPPTGTSDGGLAVEQAPDSSHSVLFAHPAPEREAAAEPSFFADLNLGQLVEAVVADHEEYGLSEFFYEPLHDPAQVDYRHQVFDDLRREEIASSISAFAAAMHEMRDRLALSTKVHDVRQRQRWFLAAAEAYCDAVERLEVDLGNVLPGSAAL
jgi:DNA mismatch repair protein MutS